MDKQPYGILILHGFASSVDSVRAIERALQPLGLPISIPALRGHDQESPEALRGTTWQDWLADAETALQSLLTRAEKVIIIGHSMGGLLTLILAADYPDDIDSIIPAAAAVQLAIPIGTNRPLHFLVPLIRRIFTKWDLPPVFTDKSLAQFDTNYHWAPIDAIVSFLELPEVTRQRLADIRVPALILHSRKDTTAAPESAEIIYRHISTPENQKRIVWFEKTEHEMFQDCERDVICDAIKAYVQERVDEKEVIRG